MREPRVSVVMPTHNRAGFVGRAVASVLAQTESDFELIIVDDASTDGTGEFLLSLARQDERIRVITNMVSKGGGGARNVGIAVSCGQWVAFLDDDDEWASVKLEIQLAKLTTSPGAVACSCSYELLFSSGSSKVIRLPLQVTLTQLLSGSVLGGASMCVCSSRVLKDIGGFDVSFESGQDWDLWVRLRQQGLITVCNESLVRYQAHDGKRITNNMSSQYLGARRFYFKYRNLMDPALRRHRLAYICFIMSRQTKRLASVRLRYLALSIHHSAPRIALTYFASSLPRLCMDLVRSTSVF
jgi:glycosyltransferase involved in cell wall biosynthesis